MLRLNLHTKRPLTSARESGRCDFDYGSKTDRLLGLHSMREPFRRPPNPWLAAIGYAILGAIAGGLSLLILPTLFVQSHSLQLMNVVLTPIAAGLAMMAIGAWRRRRDQEVIRLDKFAYGYLFALAMALVRFNFGS